MTGKSLCSKFRTVLSKIIFNLSALILSFIVAGLVIPIGSIVFIPIHIFRRIVSRTKNYFQPSFGKILTTRSTNFSNDEIYKSPECLNLVSMTFEGNLPLEMIRQKFCNHILVERLPNGDIRYPELKQYPLAWFGFKFWKDDIHFDIKNHTALHPKSLNGTSVVTDSDLWNIRQDLLRKPFKRNQSLWELLIVHNYKPSHTHFHDSSVAFYSVMYLRIHHSVADGYSILKLLVEVAGNQSISTTATASPNLNSYKTSVLKKIFNVLFFPFQSLYEFSECMLRMAKTPWTVSKSRRTHPVHAVANYIPIEVVKRVKKHYGVSFTSVVLSACTGAIIGIMTKKGMKIPDKIVSVCPLPMPGHPDKLRNFMSQGFIELPMRVEHSPEVRLKRLQILHKSYEKLKRSTVPLVSSFIAVAIGGLFTFLSKLVVRTVVPSVLITNFPADIGCISIGGHRCMDCFFACGLINMPGLGFYILSYYGALRVVVVSDNSLLSADEMIEFACLFEKEIGVLDKNMTV